MSKAQIIEIPPIIRQTCYDWSEAAENIPEEEVKLILKHSGLTTAQQEVINHVRTFIIKAIDAARNRESRVLIIKGEWGFGKTLLGKIIGKAIKDLLKSVPGINIIYKRMNLNSIIMQVITKCRNDPNVIGCFEETFLEPAKKYIAQQNTVVIMFVDEFEWLRGHRFARIGGIPIIDLMADFLKDFRDRESIIGRKYGGKVHIIFASTPSAYQIFIASLKEIGYHGWLERRIDTVNLYPAAKHEIINIIDVIIHHLFKADPQNLFKDARLKELFYTISQGNIGIAISMLNQIICYSAEKCIRDNGKNCIYKIDEDIIIESLRNYSLSTPMGNEIPLNKVLFNNMLTTRNKIEELIKFLLTSSSVLLPKDLNNKNLEVVVNYAATSLGVKIIEAISFSFKEPGKMLNIMNKLADIIHRKYSDYEKYIIILSLSNLVHLTKDGRYVITLPKSSEYLSSLLSFFEPIDINHETYAEILETLKSETYEKIDSAIIIAPEEYAKIYPVVTPNTLPFIQDRSAAKIAYLEARDEIQRDIESFERDLEAAVVDLFLTLNLAVRDKNSRLQIIVREDNGVVRAPLDVKVFMKNVLENAERFKEKCNDTKLCILICPDATDTVVLNGIFKGWNRIIIPIKPRDTYYLVASRIAKRKGFKINLEELHKYYELLSNKYGFSKIGKEWRQEGLKRGVIVPRELLNMYSIPGKEKSPYSVFREGYKTLLLGGDEYCEDDLMLKIAKIYRAIPYHSKEGKFCNVPVPSYIKLDLEPENVAGYVPEEKIKSRASYILDKILSVAKVNNMALSSTDNYGNNNTTCIKRIKLTLHPIERRILKLIEHKCSSGKIRKVPISQIMDQFIFTESVNASRRLFETLLSILEARGHIIMHNNEILCVDVEKYVSNSYEDIAYRYQKIQTLLRKLKDLLSEIGITDESINNTILHVLVAKKKGWKVIFLQDVISLLEEFLNSVDYRRKHLGLRNLRFTYEMLDYTEKLIENIIYRAIKGINNINDNLINLEEKLCELEEIVERDIVSNTLLNEVFRTTQEYIHDTKKSLLRIIEKYDAIVAKQSKEELIESVKIYLVGKRKQQENFLRHFHYERGCTESFTYGDYPGTLNSHFNFILYELNEKVFSDLCDISNKINKIEEIIYNLLKFSQEIENIKKSYPNVTIHPLIEKEVDILRNSVNIDDLLEKLKEGRKELQKKARELKKREEEVRHREKIILKIREQANQLRNELTSFLKKTNQSKQGLEIILHDMSKYIPSGELTEKLNKLYENIIIKTTEDIEEIQKIIYEISSADPALIDETTLNRYLRDLEKMHKESVKRLSKVEEMLRDLGKQISDFVDTKIENLEYLFKKIKRVPNIIENHTALYSKIYSKIFCLRNLRSELDNIIQNLLVTIHRGSLSDITKLKTEIMKKLEEIIKITQEIKELIFRNLKLNNISEQVFLALSNLTSVKGERIRMSDLVSFLSKELKVSENEILVALYELEKIGLVIINTEVRL